MTVFTNTENQAWANALPGKMCSACLILRAENKVLMVKASYKDHWTFPSGIVDAGETPKQAAIRETLEETGHAVNEQAVELFKVIFTLGTNGDRDRFNISFITDLKEASIETNIPNDEIAEYRWVAFEEVGALANNKASYLQFQEGLLNPQTNKSYVEV